MQVQHLKKAIEEALASGDIRENQPLEFALPIIWKATIKLSREQKED